MQFIILTFLLLSFVCFAGGIFLKVWTMCNLHHSIHTLFKRVHLLFLCHRFFKTKLRHVSSHMLRHMSPFVLFFPPLKRIVHWFQCELLSTTSGNLRAIFIDFYRKSRDLWYVTRFLRFFWQFVNLQRKARHCEMYNFICEFIFPHSSNLGGPIQFLCCWAIS